MKRYLIYRKRRAESYRDKVLVVTGLPSGRHVWVSGGQWHWETSASSALLRDPIAWGTPIHHWDSVFSDSTYIEIAEDWICSVMNIVLTLPIGTELSTVPEIRDAIIPFGSRATTVDSAPPSTTPRRVTGSKTNHKIGVPKNRLP